MSKRYGDVSKLLVLGVMILTAGEAVAAAQTPVRKDERAAADAQAIAVMPLEFRLSPGDVVEVKFFYNPELNDSIQITPDGHVSLQLIGDVDLNGKTISQASKLLESEYSEFLKTPMIAIQVKGYGSRKAYVGGEVLRPGVVSLLSDLSVLEAIMEAGGPKLTGDTSSVFLIRKDERGLPFMRKLTLWNKKNEPTPDSMTRLLAFDVILVSETRIAKAARWIDQHIRQVSPLILSGGFSYLFNTGVLR